MSSTRTLFPAAPGTPSSTRTPTSSSTARVAVIAGRNDRVVGYGDQFRTLRNYPRGTYCALEAAGHYLPFEQPALFRTLTQNWLHRCGA